MFGIGGSEIIVILIVALLFLGPDKLPEATKLVSKGIRDLKKQQRLLQQTIENDEQIGGAIRDIKSALRGEEEPVRRPPVRKEPPKDEVEGDQPAETPTIMPPGHDAEGRLIEPVEADAKRVGALTLPETAGEPDLDTANGKSEGDDDLASLIKPAASAVAKSEPAPPLPVTKPLSPVAKPAAKLPPPRPTPLPKPAPTIAQATAAAASSDEPETVKARPSAKPAKTDG